MNNDDLKLAAELDQTLALLDDTVLDMARSFGCDTIHRCANWAASCMPAIPDQTDLLAMNQVVLAWGYAKLRAQLRMEAMSGQRDETD